MQLRHATYEYDKNGQRIKVGGTFARTNLPDPVSSATYDDANRPLTFDGFPVAHDNNGNLLSVDDDTFTWNVRDQLVGIVGTGLSASFQYDGLQRFTIGCRAGLWSAQAGLRFAWARHVAPPTAATCRRIPNGSLYAIENSYNIAHVIYNGDEALGSKRPLTAPDTASIPVNEIPTYNSCLEAAAQARREQESEFDPTNGAINFNFRNGDSTAPFYRLPLQTQEGPFRNGFPTSDLGPTNIYANTYGR